MTPQVTICIFAKPLEPGKVKTRLAPVIGNENAALIARALLEDTIAAATSIPNARVVLSVTEQFENPGCAGLPQWLQSEGDLGTRVEQTLRRALRESSLAIALGADTPGLTPAMLESAITQLNSADAVAGPAEDGGYYLLGLKSCPQGLLDQIRWSGPHALADTMLRLQKFGLSCSLAQEWFDLDTAGDLQRVTGLIRAERLTAPRLSHAIQQIKSSVPVSVVIPVLNERACLPFTIASVRNAIPQAQIIVSDGGSTDGSREWLCGQPDVTLVDSARGKGPQQNAGAAIAGGDVLVFLHADCQLPQDAGEQLRRALRSPKTAGGCFDVRFAERRPFSLHVLSFLMNMRARVLRRCFGDQALFIRRSVFQQMGGFPDWPLFEDYEFVRRMKTAGKFVVIPSPITISARRFIEYGVWRTVLRVFILQAGYYLGVSPARLKRLFPDIRPHLGQTPSRGQNLMQHECPPAPDVIDQTESRRSTGTQRRPAHE